MQDMRLWIIWSQICGAKSQKTVNRIFVNFLQRKKNMEENYAENKHWKEMHQNANSLSGWWNMSVSKIIFIISICSKIKIDDLNFLG